MGTVNALPKLGCLLFSRSIAHNILKHLWQVLTKQHYLKAAKNAYLISEIHLSMKQLLSENICDQLKPKTLRNKSFKKKKKHRETHRSPDANTSSHLPMKCSSQPTSHLSHAAFGNVSTSKTRYSSLEVFKPQPPQKKTLPSTRIMLFPTQRAWRWRVILIKNKKHLKTMRPPLFAPKKSHPQTSSFQLSAKKPWQLSAEPLSGEDHASKPHTQTKNRLEMTSSTLRQKGCLASLFFVFVFRS